MEDWLTATEAAEALGISYHALLKRIEKGKIKATKRGWNVFIHREEVERVRECSN